MADDTYPTFLHRWFDEVWNQGRADRIAQLARPDAIVHGLTGATDRQLPGLALFEEVYKSFRSAIPDIRFEIEEVVTQGNKCVARCRVTGTHTGEGLGMPPTGKRIDITGLCMVRLEGGLIAEAWNQYDFVAMYRQLGVGSLQV